MLYHAEVLTENIWAVNNIKQTPKNTNGITES